MPAPREDVRGALELPGKRLRDLLLIVVVQSGEADDVREDDVRRDRSVRDQSSFIRVPSPLRYRQT